MKKILSILLAVSLIFCSLPFFNQTDALETYRTVTKYHLDLGVIHIWSSDNGATWQNNLDYGTTPSAPFTASLTFPDKITKVVGAYVLNEDEFDWNDQSGIYTYNKVKDYLTSKDSYEYSYKPYMSSSISSIKATKNGEYTIDLSYKAKLKEYDEIYNLADMLNRGKFNDIIALLGGEGSVKQDLYNKLENGKDGVGKGVLGYMFFVPIVIEYQTIEKVVIEPGKFEAHLGAPATAKPGETFDVTDQSLFGDESEFGGTKLTYCVDGGSTKTVSGWTGDALGETISQSFANNCTVKYTITTWNIWGDSDTDSKTVVISDEKEPEIEVEPDLILPEYTYEGHKEVAKDESTFVVDGKDYSASRTYAEGLASNSFKADSGTVSIRKVDSTKAECTFSQRGTYSITLNIRADGGGRASDTESIEVRKTPSIIDSLSGFQKQNRKQVLTATVATYPGKPLTDYAITLKDKKTGDLIRLTPGNPQQNTATIKTRVVTMTQDLEKGFAYITLEFLTKTPSYFSTGTNTQDFYYQIDVTDSKGDTDTKSKTFSVSPDLPPTPAISLDSAFLRNKGTNIASIKAEDVTVAKDGDDVYRTWYYAPGITPTSFTDVSTMDGYQKLSFGTDKIVGFNKTGVGKFTTKLFVKEKWTEPTLEEYVTDADHLTSSTMAYSNVQNVAPIVSLELLSGKEQQILLLAKNDSEYQSLSNNKTALQQVLLANKIDGQILIKKLIGDTPSDVTGIQQKLFYQFPTTIWPESSETDRNEMTVDSERTYFTTWTITGANRYTVPATVHAYSPYSGEVWSYTTSRDEIFTFGNDDTGTYLYLIYPNSNQTVLLDKRTGAVAGTLNIALSQKVWLTDNLAFYLQDGSLYAVDLTRLTKLLIFENVSAVSRVKGNLQFITKSGMGIVRNILDPKTLAVQKRLLIDTSNGSASPGSYNVACIDSTGKAVVYKETGVGSDSFNGIRVYSAEDQFIKEIPVSISNGYRLNPIFAPLDERGESHHVVVWQEYTDSSPNKHDFIGVNLDTGSTATISRNDNLYNSMHFGACFELKGVSYLYGEGWYLNNGRDYCGSGCRFSYDGSSLNIAYSGPGMNNSCDEVFRSSDRMISSIWGNNSTGVLQLKISSFPKTLAQETAEIISRFTSKLTFLGDSSTTAEQIKAAAQTPRPTVKITAAQDGYLTLPNQAFTPGTKYYYEYEIKPLTNGTASKLSGIAAANGTAASSQSFNNDTLYVTDSYEENFNSGTIHPFFTVDDPGAFLSGRYGAYYNSGKDSDGHTQLSFTVPAGKQAILSFDYKFVFNYRYYDVNNIFVDGLRMDENPKTTADQQGYVSRTGSKIFYKVLDPGTHTIECRTSGKDWQYVLLDNLKVDLLSTTPKTNAPTVNMAPGAQTGWYNVGGTFNTLTKTLSYGAQQSYPYYGGLAGQVTSYYYYRGTNYPAVIEYYETVPAGYLQKGTIHLVTNYLYSSPRVTYNIANVGTYEYQSEGVVDEWVFDGIKPAGSYTHTVTMKRPERYSGWIDGVNIVTYPDNEVTQTGNMAFNSANTECFFPKVTSTGLTSLSMYLPKGEYLLKNLKLYSIENGQKIYLQNEDCEELTDLSKWNFSSGLSASLVTPKEEKKDDDYVKIYKKGEKVLYNILYDDYEKDPSKAGYWVYSHIPWPPDTLHPDAGKTLTAPIDRFYLSGKYTVTHWEVDNTQRPGTSGDATPYNKESNKVEMTFYVDGSGKAPWITYIKTSPVTVKENNNYSIQVGVDDAEKDTLKLVTEVYLNGKLIKTDTKTGLNADVNGNYPEQTISGLPGAQVGVYQVICTVSDYSGTGIKAYKFTVVSEGKITGQVNHTDQWNTNRKKYNLKRFADEVNRVMLLNDYIAMAEPRKRGINVFWSGERFMLRAETEGEPDRVSVQIFSKDFRGDWTSTGYSSNLSRTGGKAAAGSELWEGSLWSASMINQWGRKIPAELTFRFTAYYSEGMTKTDTASVIVDSDRDYWQLHRLW